MAPFFSFLVRGSLARAGKCNLRRMLAIGSRLGAAGFVSHVSVFTATITSFDIAINKGVDVLSGLKKFNLPRPDRPYFNNPIEDSFGHKNRTAELAASKGGSLVIALLITKALFPLRLPFAAALSCPVANLLDRWRTINNSKSLIQVTLLSITIHVEPVLVALWVLWITGGKGNGQAMVDFAEKADAVIPVSRGKGNGQAMVDFAEKADAVIPASRGKGNGQAMVDFGEEVKANAVFPASRGKGNGQAMVDFGEEVKAYVVFLASRGKGNGQGDIFEPKIAMSNLKVNPKGAGKMYPRFKPHALDEIYASAGISYIDMFKKLLG